MPTNIKPISQFSAEKTTPGQGSDYLAVDEDQGSSVFTTKKVHVGQIAITPVDTIAALRAIKVPGTGQKGRVKVMGYYAAGDVSDIPVYVYKSGASAGTYVDNGGNVIVPTGGDGSAAWVYESDIFDIMWFGAVGDGVTDDYASIDNAVQSGSIKVSRRGFICGSTIRKTVSAGTGFSIIGTGKGSSCIIFKDLSGIIVTLSGFSTPTNFAIKDISLYASQAGGEALLIRSDSTLESCVTVSNVEVCGYSGVHDASNFFATCIHTYRVRFCFFDNLSLWGRENNNGSTNYGLRIEALTSEAQFGFYINNISITNCDTGIYASGWVEGIYATVGEIWSCKNPVCIDRTGATLAGTVRFSNFHFNGSGDVFTCKNVTTVGLTGCEVYQGVEIGTLAAINAVNLDGCYYCQIVGNSISTAYSGYASNGIMLTDCTICSIVGNLIRLFASNEIAVVGSDNVVIGDNNIIGPSAGTGIYVDSASTLVTINRNQYSALIARVADGSGNAAIQKNIYSGTAVKTLTGGALYEYVTIAIPSDILIAKASSALMQVSASGTDTLFDISYYYDSASNNSTACVFMLRSKSGSNISAGTYRFSFSIWE